MASRGTGRPHNVVRPSQAVLITQTTVDELPCVDDVVRPDPAAEAALALWQKLVRLNHVKGHTTMGRDDQFKYTSTWAQLLPHIEKLETALKSGAYNSVYEISARTAAILRLDMRSTKAVLRVARARR